MTSAQTLLDTLSLKEFGRLLTIVASSASIAWAGQLAHSSEPITTETSIAAMRATERVLSLPETPKPVRGLSGFAQAEIRRASELYQALTERAELLPEGPQPSDMKIRESLENLDASLVLSRMALVKLKESRGSSRSFAEENMKSQLFRLQESSREAQGLFIARENAQSFSISRTGQ